MPRSTHTIQELNLLEQVHLALSSASSLDDFYMIVAALLLDTNSFNFSRAFFIRFDEKSQTFSGRLALGARTRDEHTLFRTEMLDETQRLNDQVRAIQQESPEPMALQPIYDLRYHSLWIQLMQGNTEGTALNSELQEVSIRRDSIDSDHLLELIASSPHAQIISRSDANMDRLDHIIRTPAVAGRLVTKRGLHGILIADRSYELNAVDEEALYHFQWLLNHCSIKLDNLELVNELTEITRRLQDVDRMKTSFLSVVSHELRTPLTSIIGFVHLVLQGKAGPVSEGQRDLLQRVENHSTHLQSMLSDLLEIAEVEAGGMISVSLGPVDPLSTLLNVLPKVEPRRGTKQITIEPQIEDKVPQIRADANMLERIYYHLLDNAIKFIPQQGKITVWIKRSGMMVNITIADTGIGMSQENLKRIFEHFYQVDSRLERMYGGMGIGLTVVKSLLDATGGLVYVESSPGKGSRFTISYPVSGDGGILTESPGS